MFDYQIFTDATSDISREMTFGLPQPEIIPMPVEIKGKAYSYGPNGNLSICDFYRMGLQHNEKVQQRQKAPRQKSLGAFFMHRTQKRQ